MCAQSRHVCPGGVHAWPGGSVRGKRDGHCSGRYAGMHSCFLIFSKYEASSEISRFVDQSKNVKTKFDAIKRSRLFKIIFQQNFKLSKISHSNLTEFSF